MTEDWEITKTVKDDDNIETVFNVNVKCITIT